MDIVPLGTWGRIRLEDLHGPSDIRVPGAQQYPDGALGCYVDAEVMRARATPRGHAWHEAVEFSVLQ